MFKLFYRRIERAYLRSVDGFIFNSETTRRTVTSFVGDVVPYVVAYPSGRRMKSKETGNTTERMDNTRENTQISLLNRPTTVLFVGSIIPRKGLHVLIKALDAMGKRYPDTPVWLLRVVGWYNKNSLYYHWVRRLVRRNGLEKKVNVLGRVEDGELELLLQDAHMLCVPSFHEGFGMVYLEAMESGLPCIGTDSGGAAEIISHGKEGFLIQPGDYKRLSHYIHLLIADRNKREEMGKNALLRSAGFCSWDKSMAKIERFLLNYFLSETH
jgi:glycosyltransferase involved in cell wall biosynthesis